MYGLVLSVIFERNMETARSKYNYMYSHLILHYVNNDYNLSLLCQMLLYIFYAMLQHLIVMELSYALNNYCKCNRW